ncbi:MAG: 5-bromo-4-chloroindolyl phosphate hydrolysis family protein [Deltaproteobacteria bacterium]|jgi:hypothetical protein|nr:5-bromo-4-chloroindolyl phosphate hydrolysis family protein [Deltaproteobacteria bacterium]
MNRLPSIVGGVFDSFKALVKRIGLHFLALCAGLAISGVGLTGTLCAYVGIICLLPLGFNPRKTRFLVPFAVSAGQFLLTWLWGGLPPALALFWAGAQTWLIQAFILRFKLGWAWTATPAILLCIAISHSSPPLSLLLLLFWGLCTICGCLAYELITAQENKNRLDQALRGVAGVLDQPLRHSTFPQPFDCQFRRLLEQSSAAYGLGLNQKSRSSATLAPPLEDLAPKLKQAMSWREEKFSEQESNYLLSALAEANQLLSDALGLSAVEKNASPAPLNKTGNKSEALSGAEIGTSAAENAEFAPFRKSVSQLLNKRGKLPDPLQKHLNALFLSTGGIITCMSEDPEDVPSGTRFLNRYLPAVHKVIDEYARLAGDGQAHANLKEALDRTEEVLERMVTAFHEEHGNLLRNDAMRFNADLNVLDKLLKMDGR